MAGYVTKARVILGCARSGIVCLHYAVYPANLCPLLFGGQFAELGGDFGEAVYHAVEDSGSGVCCLKGTAKHLEDMLGGLDSPKAAEKSFAGGSLWREGERSS